jgi:hypothetical protein
MAATINPNWYWCDKDVQPLASRLGLAAKLEKYCTAYLHFDFALVVYNSKNDHYSI